MSDKKISKKYAISGLLVLLVAGAVLFFAFRAFQGETSGDMNSPLDFKTSNNPEIDLTVDGLKQTEETVPHAVIENSMSELNEQDQEKFQTFLDISRGGKDNDPRMDKDLKNLSADLKKELQNYYKNLAPEKRNERGLVAFLIAREISSSEDMDFLQDVISEEPCLSMQDCKVLTPRDPHLAPVDEMSLNYPSLAILYQIDSRLGSDPQFLTNSSGLKNKLSSVLAKGAASSVPKIREKSEQIQKKYSL